MLYEDAHSAQECAKAHSFLQNLREYRKNELHEQHVQNRAADDGEQQVVPPFVDDNDEHGTDELRQSMRTGKYRDIFKTVNDEHCDRSARERCAEVGNNARRFFPAGNRKNGRARIRKVPSAIMPIVITSCRGVCMVIWKSPFEITKVRLKCQPWKRAGNGQGQRRSD